MKRAVLVAGSFVPVSALAFFDPFDGTSLGAHWDFFSEGSSWTHTVSGGELRVTALSGPFDFDEVGITANVEGFTDFVAEARVLWDAGIHQTFSFGLSEQFPFMNPRIGTMRYDSRPATGASVSASLNGGGNGSAGAPPANQFHVFRMTRTGTLVQAFVDGNLLAQVDPGSSMGANKVFLHFGGPETADFGEFRVDFVSVVPEPASLAALGLGIVALSRARKKARKGP